MKSIYQEVYNTIDADLPFPKGKISVDIPKRRENFKIIHECLDQIKLDYWLMFGTLLGATREKDFIAWDCDTDIGVFALDRKKIIEFIKLMGERGFEPLRFMGNDSLLSMVRDREYVDIYLWTDCEIYYSCSSWRIDKDYFDNRDTMEFMGKTCQIPSKHTELLRVLYGDWQTPKKGFVASPYINRDGGINYHA